MKIAVGIGLVGIGLVLFWSGLAPLSESWGASDGYFMSNPLVLERRANAVVASDVDLLRGRYDTLAEETFLFELLGEPRDVRVEGTAGPNKELFIGIAPTPDVEAYLEDVSHEAIVDWDTNQSNITDVSFEQREGAAVPEHPDDQIFWVASASGEGEQSLDWSIQDGEWTFVVMPIDASGVVDAELRLGTAVPAGLSAVAGALAATGLAAVLGGGVILGLQARRRRERIPSADDNGVETVQWQTASAGEAEQLRDAGGGLRAAFDRLRPSRSPVLFPLTVAGLWALAVGVFASVSRLFGPEGERGTWGEVLDAVAGNFLVALVLASVVTISLRIVNRRR